MKYGGMTVNERLWVSGLYDEFYASVDRKDNARVVDILKSVELDDETIQMNLEFFGFDESGQIEAPVK